MAVDVDRAEARILDHCSSYRRWLDEAGVRTSAAGRLDDTLDDHTLHMLRSGLVAHPYRMRDALSTTR